MSRKSLEYLLKRKQVMVPLAAWRMDARMGWERLQ